VRPGEKQVGRSATLRRDRQQAKQDQLPRPWKHSNHYEYIDLIDWAVDMNTRWGRGIIVYYSNKMPTCYLMGCHADVGAAETLMLEQYAPWTQAVISIPTIQPIVATPENYSSMPFVTRIAEFSELNTKIIVPKCDHTHPGLVFR
jgi:hypothetical protein